MGSNGGRLSNEGMRNSKGVPSLNLNGLASSSGPDGCATGNASPQKSAALQSTSKRKRNYAFGED